MSGAKRVDASPAASSASPSRPNGSPGRQEAPQSASPSSGALKGRGRKEGPWTRHFLRLDEHQSKTVYLSICRFCLAAHTDAPNAVPPPRKVPARRASQIPHLKRCPNVPPGQARADVDALLAVYGNLAVPYAAPGKDKDGNASSASTPPPQPAAVTRAPKRAPRAARSPAAPTAASTTTERAREADDQPSRAVADAPRPVRVESPNGQYVAPALAPPQYPSIVVNPVPQYLPPPQQTQQQQQRQQPQVLAHPPPPPPVLARPPPSPVQQVNQQAVRQFQTLVADVAFENGIQPEWVESSTLKRLVRWLRPELERVLPTADAISGSLLSQAAAYGADADQSDMDAFVKQGARVAVLLRVEDTDPRGEHGKAALFRVFLASLSAFKCFDVRRVLCYEHDDVTPRLVGEVHGVLDRVGAAIVPVGSVCLHAPERFARLGESVARENPQLIVMPCFAHSVNTVASAVFRTPLIRSTLLAVAETIDAILSPPAVVKGTARAIPWQLAVFSTVSVTYGAPLELTRVESTRWTSAYEAVASVLRVRSALREFAASHYSALKTHPVARNAVTMLRDDAFWVACEALEAVLRPLTVAAHWMSSGDVTLAQMVSTFTEMARSLLPAASTNSQHHGQNMELYTQERTLLVEVEALWSRCGVQRVALLAYFLHPETRDRALELRETELTSAARLAESAITYYHAFFGANEPTNKLRGDLMKWRNGTLAKDVRSEEFDNWLSYWEYIRECKIAVELARLAIFVLSAGVNTGTCEELWCNRSFGSRDCGFARLHQHTDGSTSLAKLKELEMARLAIDRQRKGDWKSEMERRERSPHGGTVQIGQSGSNCNGVASSTELPKVMAQGSVPVNIGIDGGAMAHAISGCQPRTQAELEVMVDSWAGYCKAAQAPEHHSSHSEGGGHARSPVDSAVVSLSELVATSSRTEASI